MFRAGLRTLLVFINHLYCIPTYMLWCLLLYPMCLIRPDLYWWIEGQLFDGLLTFVAFWSYSAEYHIVETGDDIDNLINEETLVLANHQSTSDVPLLMQAFSGRRGLTERLSWIMDARFQFTPFGVVSTVHGDFFVKNGPDRRNTVLDALDCYLKETFAARKRKWLVLFPEGGFLHKRMEANKLYEMAYTYLYALKMNLPSLDYVTLPRMGAFTHIINKLGLPSTDESGDRTQSDGLKYILDLTIAYPDGKPLDLVNVIAGNAPPCRVRIHYEVYSINKVPCHDPEKLEEWLNNIYIEKNNILGHYYRTGVWNPKLAKLVGITPSDSMDELSPPLVDVYSIESRPVLASLIKLMLTPQPGVSVTELEGRSSNSSWEEDESIYEPLSVCNRSRLAEGDRILQLDIVKIVMVHAIFIVSSIFHITFCRMVFDSILSMMNYVLNAIFYQYYGADLH